MAFLQQQPNASSQGRQVDEDGLNFMLAVVNGVMPHDQLETMFAAEPPFTWPPNKVCTAIELVEIIQQRAAPSALLTSLCGHHRVKVGRSVYFSTLADIVASLAPNAIACCASVSAISADPRCLSSTRSDISRSRQAVAICASSSSTAAIRPRQRRREADQRILLQRALGLRRGLRRQ